jgi:hypothetical protein
MTDFDEDVLFQRVLKAETAFYDTLEARMALSKAIRSRGDGRCSMLEAFTMDLYKSEQQHHFIEFCKTLSDFVQNSKIKPTQVEIHDYFQERKAYPSRFTSMLAKPYPNGVPQGCHISFRGENCEYEYWLVLTSDPSYMAKDAKSMGYDLSTVRDQQLNRERLLQSGFITVDDDPETTKRLQKHARDQGESIIMLDDKDK